MAGPLTNQSGQTNTPQNVTQPNKTTISTQYSNTSSKPNISNSNSNTGKGMNTINIPEEKLEEMIYDPKTNFKEILKDPNNQNTVMGYILGKSADTNYKNKDRLSTLINTNKDLQTAVNTFMANSKK